MRLWWVKVGSLRGMPRADLSACKLCLQAGADISAMRVKLANLRGMPRASLNGWRLCRQTGGIVATQSCARAVQSAP